MNRLVIGSSINSDPMYFSCLQINKSTNQQINPPSGGTQTNVSANQRINKSTHQQINTSTRRLYEESRTCGMTK
jgi:hypothetical protein